MASPAKIFQVNSTKDLTTHVVVAANEMDARRALCDSRDDPSFFHPDLFTVESLGRATDTTRRVIASEYPACDHDKCNS